MFQQMALAAATQPAYVMILKLWLIVNSVSNCSSIYSYKHTEKIKYGRITNFALNILIKEGAPRCCRLQ